VETFTNTIGLRVIGLGLRVINVLDAKIKLKRVMIGLAAIFSASVRQNAKQGNAL